MELNQTQRFAIKRIEESMTVCDELRVAMWNEDHKHRMIIYLSDASDDIDEVIEAMEDGYEPEYYCE